jgi:threonine synthase
VSVSDADLLAAMPEIGAAEGVLPAPEGAACLPALKHLLARGAVSAEERVVLFNTGSGLKYLDLLPRDVR